MIWADGTPAESVDFDFDAVDQALAGANTKQAGQQAKCDPSPILTLQDCPDFHQYLRLHPGETHSDAHLRRALDWILQTIPKNNNGIEIRATVAGMVWLPHLRNKTETEVALMLGKDKQSLGRWITDFKREFPTVRTSFMR